MPQTSPLAAFSRFTQQQPKARVASVGLLLLLLCAGLDYGLATRLGLVSALPYLVPILGLAWFWGWPAALTATAASALFHYFIHAALVAPPVMSALTAIASGVVFIIALPVARGLLTMRLMIEYYYRGHVWRANQKPIQVTPRILIVPSLTPAPQNSVPAQQPNAPITLYLSPGMAFGTGSHPTTRMCLALLEKYVRPHDKVLDIGSGTGILSIAAIELGAQSALAVDIDPEAERITLANAELNDVSDQLEFRPGSIEAVFRASSPTPDYHIVLGNLLTHIILSLFAHGLAQVLAPGGILIVSGIRLDQAGQVLSAIETAGLQFVEQRQSGDWVAIAAKRN